MVLNPPDDTVITRHPLAIGVIRSESTQIVKALAREASRRYRIRLETSFLRRAGS